MITPEYVEADKKVKQLMRNAKRKYEKRLANGEGGNNRAFFSYIKKKTKSRTTTGPLTKNGETVASEEGMV
jgi:hypothetical protein